MSYQQVIETIIDKWVADSLTASLIVNYNHLYYVHNENYYYQSNSRRSNENPKTISTMNDVRVDTSEKITNDSTITCHNDASSGDNYYNYDDNDYFYQ